MKKLYLHLDAVIIITMLFLVSIAFIAIQRVQYNEIIKENLSLKVEKLKLEYSKSFLEVSLNNCESFQ